jgi:hypothetical protein
LHLLFTGVYACCSPLHVRQAAASTAAAGDGEGAVPQQQQQLNAMGVAVSLTADNIFGVPAYPLDSCRWLARPSTQGVLPPLSNIVGLQDGMYRTELNRFHTDNGTLSLGLNISEIIQVCARGVSGAVAAAWRAAGGDDVT